MSISITFYQRYLHLLQGYVKPQGHVLVYETCLFGEILHEIREEVHSGSNKR
jgi:hypothetical protein